MLSTTLARRFFLHFPNPDVFMYKTVIRGFSESGTPQNSFSAFIDMHRKSMVPPDRFSFAFVLKAAANYGSLRPGIQLHFQALVHGFSTHLFVGSTLISMYGECNSVYFAKNVFEQMLEANVVAWNAIVTVCFRCGDVKGAKMFDMMPFKNSTSSNVMLAGYAKAGEMELALKVFWEMKVRDGVSLSTMIVGFVHNGCFHEAFGYFRELQWVGLRPNEVSLTGVLSSCAQGGAFEFGKILHGFIEKSGFNSITSVNNALKWICMQEGLAMHGYAEDAVQGFHEMERCGIRPDWITSLLLLHACSHAGLIEQGCSYFYRMKDVYDIEPTIKRYGCMVDLLFSVPAEFLGTLSWRSKKLKDVATVRRTTAEAYEKLNEIILRLKLEGGYVPEVASVLHDIEEEEKEDSVSKHSEKLAVAFGISRLCKGRVIRLVKNLRICGDCHTVMKLIYKDNVIHTYYEEHEKESTDPPKNVLMIPTISDVNTVEEWRAVAKDIVGRSGKVNWRATIVDWPGLGYSSRPKMDYDADVMEKFVVDFINKKSSPALRVLIVNSMERGSDKCRLKEVSLIFLFLLGFRNAFFLNICVHFYLFALNDLVVFGGGHAATIAVRAAKKGLVKPKAIAAVAPTWDGPLPIVFGQDSSMQTRYGLLRGTLRAPAIGWMMYNMLVSNEGAIQSQHKSHVYANPKNVTQEIVQSRYKLTTKKGSRYVPAAFLTGLLDPVNSREEFLELFANLEGKMSVLVVSTEGSPKRSKAEMEALREAKGISKFVEVPGALLPQEEYPTMVAEELYQFLQENFEVNA
ncbi:hypothetical protein CRYUN_Cryun19dG0036100 [Craigia yunnanensis]